MALLLVALLLAAALAGCGGRNGEDGPSAPYSVVVMETTEGDITLRLYDDEVPVTVGNFLALAHEDAYDGAPFHRIISGFMMQGGGGGDAHPDFADAKGNIPDEFHPDLLHDGPGVLAMANTGSPDTGSRQFYITFRATPHLDAYDDGAPKPCESRRPGTLSCHAVFGEVTEGLDVVQKVEREVASQGGNPRRAMSLEAIRFVQCGPAAPAGACADAVPPSDPLGEGGDAPLGLITPGRWDVGGMEDHILVWTENREEVPIAVHWSAAFPDGAPDGWEVTPAEEETVVPMAGATTTGLRGETVHRNWTWTVFTLRVPEGAAAQTARIAFSNGHESIGADVVVGASLDRVTHRDDVVDVSFNGTFADTDESFYAGSIPDIVLGSGGLVPGVDLGLFGLRVNETQTLVVPPPLAYSYDNPPTHAQFDGRWLHFTVTVDAIQG